MTGYYPGSCQRILGEAISHKYTHAYHNLSAMNIKYYKFGSSFVHQSFAVEKVHIDAKAIQSMIEGQHHTLRCHPQKRSTSTGSSSTGPTVESGPLAGNRRWHHRKGDKNYLDIVRSIR
jgi:hypothetical protein